MSEEINNKDNGQITFMEMENNQYSSVEEEITKLREKINYYSQLYYDMDNSPITDFEFDTMMNRLKKLEKEHPELITKDSPTQKVGGHVREDFAKVTHEVPLRCFLLRGAI